MKINLQKLQENKQYNYDSKDEWVKEFLNEINKTEPFNIKSAKFTLSFQKPSDNPNLFFLNLKVDTDLQTECNYCLSDYALKIDEEQDFIAINNKPSNDQHKDTEEETNDFEDEPTISLINFHLDIINIAKETIFLNIPIVFKCSEACLGLCTKCGVNLNVQKCNCNDKSEFTNNKFNVLKDFDTGG